MPLTPGGREISAGAIEAHAAIGVKDMSPYAVVEGNLAKVIRLSLADEQG